MLTSDAVRVTVQVAGVCTLRVKGMNIPENVSDIVVANKGYYYQQEGNVK